MFESGQLSGCDVSARRLHQAVQEECPLPIAYRDNRSVPATFTLALPGDTPPKRFVLEVEIDETRLDLPDRLPHGCFVQPVSTAHNEQLADLIRWLDMDYKSVTHLLDLNHGSRITALERALAELGKSVTVTIHDRVT